MCVKATGAGAGSNTFYRLAGGGTFGETGGGGSYKFC